MFKGILALCMVAIAILLNDICYGSSSGLTPENSVARVMFGFVVPLGLIVLAVALGYMLLKEGRAESDWLDD